MFEKRRKCFIRATCKVKENVHKKVRERRWKRRVEEVLKSTTWYLGKLSLVVELELEKYHTSLLLIYTKKYEGNF